MENSIINPDSFIIGFDDVVAYDDTLVTTKMALCKEVINNNKDEKIKKILILEYDLLSLWNQIFYIFGQVNEKRFVDSKKEKINEFLKKLSSFVNSNKSESDYFKHRLRITKNNSDKLRYSLVCWFFFKEIIFLEMTINLALDCVTKLMSKKDKKSTDYILPSELLSFSFFIFQLFAHTNYTLKELIKSKLLQFVSDVVLNNYLRWLIEPIEILDKLIDKKDIDLTNKLISDLHRGAYLLSKEELPLDKRITNCGIERSLIEVSIDLIKHLQNLDEPYKNSLIKIFRSKLAYSYEREASLRKQNDEEELVIAICCYKPVWDLYIQIGDKEKVNECSQLFLQNFKLDSKHETIVKIEIPPYFGIKGKDENEIIEEISIFNGVIPDESFIEGIVNHEIEKNPLISAVPIQRVNEQGPTDKLAIEEKNIKENLLLDKKILFIQIVENSFSKTIHQLELEKKLTVEGIMKWFHNFEIFNKKNSYFIQTGIERHFDKDYVSSIHILMPQFESILRNLLLKNRINVIKEKSNSIMDKELGGILTEGSIILGTDLCNYFKIKYAGLPKGMNLRNKISHGLLDISEVNHVNSFFIIYAIIKLLKKSV